MYEEDEYVGLTEKDIGTVKDRTWYMHYDVPYKKYTGLMAQSLVGGAVEILNYPPYNNSFIRQ